MKKYIVNNLNLTALRFCNFTVVLKSQIEEKLVKAFELIYIKKIAENRHLKL